MIVRPEILPEEYALGYRGRVMACNGMTDSTDSVNALLKWSGNARVSRHSFSTVELLAALAGMDVGRFVCSHTLLPLRRAVVASFQGVEHGCTKHRSILWSTALRVPRPGTYLCTECIKEDLDFHGTPYWRREHQMPGLYWCTKHRLALGYIEASNAYLSPPSAYYKSHQPVDHGWVQQLQQSAPIQRFLAISSDLLARSKPLDELAVSRAAKARAIGLGLHAGRGVVERRLVSDLIKERFDSAWLGSVFPELAEKPVGEYVPSIESALYGKRHGVASAVYALVFAALFDTPEEAVNAMVEASAEERAKARSSAVMAELSDQQLQEAYVTCRGSHAAVARELGLGAYVVRKRLLEMGLPSLGSAVSPLLWNAVTCVFTQGVSLDQASKLHNVDRMDLERLLLQAAGPFRAALTGMRTTSQRRRSAPKPKPVAPPRQVGFAWSAGERSMATRN